MPSLIITTIQSDLTWEDKQANIEMFDRKIRSIDQKTQVVILPEMFTTGFSMDPAKFAEPMSGPTISWMKAIAAEKKIILTGSLIIEENGRFYNRLVWMLPTGQFGSYDKRHLFGFAGEDQFYTPGNKRIIASVNGWKILLQVCYDLRFPVWARQQSAVDQDFTPEYDLLINVANWPERRSHAWKTLLMARAIENQAYVVGVNRVGNDGHGIYHGGETMIVDPMGGLLYQKAHEEDIYTVTLQKAALEETRDKLPFLKDADQFTIINEEL